MTQKKVEVIPATKRSVHNGGQLEGQSNIPCPPCGGILPSLYRG